MNIVAVSFDMAKAVEVFIQKARRFFYSVMLLGHRCPQCGGRLLMVAESRCQCTRCSGECDPTVQFERCLECGGVPGRDIKSRFLFDGLVFNAEYFISNG
jgi:hypothetical protein